MVPTGAGTDSETEETDEAEAEVCREAAVTGSRRCGGHMLEEVWRANRDTKSKAAQAPEETAKGTPDLEETARLTETAEPEDTFDLEETTRLEETTKLEETDPAEHRVEGETILIPRLSTVLLCCLRTSPRRL